LLNVITDNVIIWLVWSILLKLIKPQVTIY
jgi:hypothetical protein